MLRALGLLGLIGTAMGLHAQSPFGFEWHGFVNPHYYADSRSVVGAREDMMLFFPKPIARDSEGNDLNDGWQADMLAITARLGLRIKGPDMLGAHTSGYVEGDFTGATNATNNNLRLRHAYIRMDWNQDQASATSAVRHSLLVGQYWHPMVVHEIMPMTNPLNMGAPFHPYSRQPQVRYEMGWQSLRVVGTASWQLDNMSQGLLNGAEASSTAFARHSLLPELNLQLRYGGKALFVGAAFNLKTILPIVPDANRELVHQPSFSLFGSYRAEHFIVRAQTLLGNNLYEIASLGGYLMLPDSTFQDWHFNTVWVDIEHTTGHWRPGLFLGFAKNIDYGCHADALHIFGRGHDIDVLWRVQPRLTYSTLKGLSFTAEAEYTRAAYAEEVGNLRLSLSAVYAF